MADAAAPETAPAPARKEAAAKKLPARKSKTQEDQVAATPAEPGRLRFGCGLGREETADPLPVHESGHHPHLLIPHLVPFYVDVHTCQLLTLLAV